MAYPWSFRCIDIMKNTKDTMQAQLALSQMQAVVNAAASLNCTHIAVSCPLDAPNTYATQPYPPAGYLAQWVSLIRAAGKKVYFRNTWLTFEGIYYGPKYTPTSTPSVQIGTAAAVVAGTDTTSYLGKTYQFIKANPTLFASGDAWGPLPEPENQGIGALTTQMFANYNQIGQFIVDLKTTADNAFTSIGVSGVMTGMTAINGGTVTNNQIGSTYYSQIGQCCVDHYVPFWRYSGDLDLISTNSGVPVYVTELGCTTGVGGSLDCSDWPRFDTINSIYSIFASKSYIRGVNYWDMGTYQRYDSPEGLCDPQTFTTRQSAMLVAKYFLGSGRVRLK